MYTEKDMEDLISSNPEEFIGEEGLRLVGRQVSFGNYRFDLLFEDRHGSKLIVEIQKGTLDRNHTYKILDYYDEYKEKNPGDFVELMVIANAVPRERRRRLASKGISFLEIPEDIFIENRRAKSAQVTEKSSNLAPKEDDEIDQLGSMTPSKQIDDVVAEYIGSIVTAPEYYFRKNKEKPKTTSRYVTFNIYLGGHKDFNFDSETFRGIVMLSQGRLEAYCLTRQTIVDARNAAFDCAGGVWIRKHNVLGPENRVIYIKADSETKVNNTVKILCSDKRHISVPCSVLGLESLSRNDSIIKLITNFVSTNLS